MAILVERLRIKAISYFNYIGLNFSCEDEIFHLHTFVLRDKSVIKNI